MQMVWVTRGAKWALHSGKLLFQGLAGGLKFQSLKGNEAKPKRSQPPETERARYPRPWRVSGFLYLGSRGAALLPIDYVNYVNIWMCFKLGAPQNMGVFI